ncbi:MAG: sulfatase [Deltaproteobacteria bacterium]|jgi:arylsulfatase A-like enzyme|nr:sulfatase [Deltaproteobacteria bacterium]MBT6434797.1 sulfatase [Deltaproteobacteria bacterium]MBT6490585.1 sulfatase [Deltaproteobacteria bacterium]
MKRFPYPALIVPGLFWCLSLGCQSDQPLPRPAKPAATEVPNQPKAPVDPLNVILITADTMRGDVSSLDGGPVSMPNLHALAQNGWHFRNSYSNSMLTTPSHVSLMTSLYPRDHGIYDNQGGIDDDATTLAESLQNAGYFTAAVIGFPHLNPNVSNLGQGFEKIIPATRENRTATKTVKEGMTLLSQNTEEKPFFMWLHMVDPHSPYESYLPGQHRDRLLSESVPMDRAIKASPGFQRNNPWFKKAFKQHQETKPLLEYYNDEVLEVDAGLGELQRALEEKGLWDNTIIVFTSDHGENLGENELYFHHGGLYEPSVKVPLVLRVPGSQAQTSSALTQTVDVAPTIMSLLELPLWPEARGKNLHAVIQGTEKPSPYVFSEHLFAQQAAVRSPSHTLILHRKSTRQFPSYEIVKGKYELFKRGSLASEDALLPITDPIATELKKILTTYLKTGMTRVPKEAKKQDMESLKALGYIE